MRIFLAVFPPPAVQDRAFAVIEALRRPDDRVSWVKRDNLHYTMRFLGEIGDDGLRRASEAAEVAAARHRAFEAVLGAAGAFPNARKARVLWLGLVHGAEALTALARDVELELRRRGFDRADRPFAPHLTIGRARERDQDWSQRLDVAAAPGARFLVDRVRVVESQLSPKGSIYTVRAEPRLATA